MIKFLQQLTDRTVSDFISELIIATYIAFLFNAIYVIIS